VTRFVLAVVLVAAALGLVSIPLFGHLSDRIGRRRMYGIGIVCIAAFAFPYYGLLNTKSSGLILLADYFERLVGVGVDDVHDIHDIPIDQFASADAPESIGEGIVTGVVEIDGKRVLVLDITALVQKVIGQGR
jgi:chemotaxis signal transduction protein